MTNLQPISKIEQNLVAIENLLNDCMSIADLWKKAEDLRVIKETAIVLKNKDVAIQAGALVCKAEFYIAKKIKLPDRSYKRTPAEKEKEDSLGLNNDLKYKLRKAYKTLDENIFKNKIKELKEKEIVPSRHFFSNEETYRKYSGDHEYYTAPRIIEAIRDLLDGIDLDPASNEFANKTVKAKTFFTKADNGLAQDWRPYRNVWINPPFDELKPFAMKFITEAKCGAFLGRTDLTATWGATLASCCSCTFFPRVKIPFYNAAGVKRSTVAIALYFLNVNPDEVIRVLVKEFRIDGTAMVPFSKHLTGGKDGV